MLLCTRNARTVLRAATSSLSSSSSRQVAVYSTTQGDGAPETTDKRSKVNRPRPPRHKDVDWSQPSTSAVPYEPAPPPQDPPSPADFAPQKRRARPDRIRNPFPGLDRALALPSRSRKILDGLISAFDAYLVHKRTQRPLVTSLTRERFDATWTAVAALAAQDTQETAFASAVLKRLRDVAAVHGFPLDLEQLGALLTLRLKRERRAHHEREKRYGLGVDAHIGRAGEHVVQGAQGDVKQTPVAWAKWEYMDEVADEYLEVLDRQAGQERAARRKSADVLRLYATTLTWRLPSAPSSPSDDRFAGDLAVARRIATIYGRAVAFASPSSSPFSTPREPDLLAAPNREFDSHPTYDTHFSRPLLPLFASPSSASSSSNRGEPSDRRLAYAHLRAGLSEGLLPTTDIMRSIVLAHYGDAIPTSSSSSAALDAAAEAEAEAAYARARAVLDEACRDPSSSSASSVAAGEGAGGGSALEALHRARLARLGRLEALERAPVQVFIRWLAFESAGGEDGAVEERREAVWAALELWEATKVRGRSEWETPARQSPRSEGAKMLEELVVEACEVEKLAPGGAVAGEGAREGDFFTSRSPFSSSSTSSAGSHSSRAPLPSPMLVTAVRLAVHYLPQGPLTHHAQRLLHACTVTSHAPSLAFALFEVVTAPPSSAFPTSHAAASSSARLPAPFTWTATLLPAFTSLFLSASSAQHPTLPLRLYLSWTASGLSFPVGLWNHLWAAAGRRHDVDELKRLVRDWEETGRGPPSSRIMAIVLEAAVAPSHAVGAAENSPALPDWSRHAVADSTPTAPAITRVLPALSILAYFRSRYALPTAPPPPLLLTTQPYLLVPLRGYIAVLSALSRSFTDRRPAFRRVWQQLLLDGHVPTTEAYNAALAAHVWRPGAKFTIRDLDAAGVVYNALIAAGKEAGAGAAGAHVQPDRQTYSLLIHGFLRIAGRKRAWTTLKRRRILTEAAVRTFEAAIARGVAPRGQQVAALVRLLAGVERWEDAKRCQEEWWRVLVDMEQGWGEGVKDGSTAGGMWEDREVAREVREMKRVRREVEQAERQWIAGEREDEVEGVEETAAEEPDPVEENVEEDDPHARDWATSPEVFDAADCRPARSSSSPPTHPRDSSLYR
ncbi:hypothetical protein JCM8097_001789 [Rhodosporidiobolus ruineniae]